MAVLGAEVLLTFATAVTLVRSAGVLALPERLFRGLVYYALPHDAELRQMFASSIASNESKKKNKNKTPPAPTELKVPKGEGAMNLDPRKITDHELVNHIYYLELETLLSLVSAATIVVALVDIYYGLVASPEIARTSKYSLVWLYIALLYSGKSIYNVSSLYFKATKELSILAAIAVLSFVFASAAVMQDGVIFDFGLDQGFSAIIDATNKLLSENGLLIKVDASLARYKLALAAMSGIVGGLLLYPCLRIARSHVAALSGAGSDLIQRALLHISFLAPVALSLAWVRPLGRDVFRDAGLESSEDTYDRIRIGAVFAFCAIRIWLARTHIQAYLNQAFERVKAATLPSTKKITVTELRNAIDSIYRLMVVVAIQILAPTLLLLCSCLALKMQGGFQWWQSPNDGTAPESHDDAASEHVQSNDSVDSRAFERNHPFTIFARGLLSYVCWWLCASQALLCWLGFAYVKVAEKTN